MKLTDLKIAEYCGITTATLRNWKNAQKIGNTVFCPPIGRHHLYTGAKLITYFISIDSHILKDDDLGEIEVSDDFICNFDYIKSDFSFVYSFIHSYCSKVDNFDYLISKLDNLKNHLDNIDFILSKRV